MKIEIEINDFLIEEIVARDLRQMLKLGTIPEDLYEHFEKVLAWYDFPSSED